MHPEHHASISGPMHCAFDPIQINFLEWALPSCGCWHSLENVALVEPADALVARDGPPMVKATRVGMALWAVVSTMKQPTDLPAASFIVTENFPLGIECSQSRMHGVCKGDAENS